MSRSLLRAAVMLVAALIVIAAATGVADARSAPPGTIRVGAVTATPAPVARHPVARSLALHLSIALRPRDTDALRAYATAVATPGSPVYHRYLTVDAFGKRFGATPTQIAAVQHALRGLGLTPGRVAADGLSIPVTAPATAIERAFAIGLDRVDVGGRRTAVRADAAPALPAAAAPHVQAVVGLDSTSTPRPLLARLPRTGASSRARGLAHPHVVTGGPQPCADATSAAPRSYSYTIDEIASAYGFSGLYGLGDQGAGTTIALYELEPDDPADIAAYQACYGTHASVSYVSVDGGAGAGAGTGEAALDIENTIGLAPKANVLVYQGPNSASSDPGSGPFDIFARIVNQDRAQVASVSWGECEAGVGPSDASAEQTLFEQAAVQGQTIVAAAGDSGAEDCYVPESVPDTNLAVDDPSSQPFVTGVGGTSMSSPGPPPTETVWNTGGTNSSSGAGGGGVSSYWPMPGAQSQASSSLGVTKSAAGGSACGQPSGFCREVPDVSADANPATGYEVYFNGSGSQRDYRAGWQGIGGTSGAAPVWGALVALVDASPACGGSPIGYADPALYRAASAHYAADFHDVTSGENDFTATNGGQFPAGGGYDLASGLGTPDAAELDGDICADTVHVSSLDAQLSTRGASVALTLRARDAARQKLVWTAKGLPRGLTIGRTTGRITGTPRKTGRSTVTVTARDGADASASGRFVWTIGSAARLSAVRLSLSRRPSLRFTAIAARNAPAIATLKLTAPHGLSLHSKAGVRVTSGGRAVRFTATARRGTLTIILRRPTARLAVRLMAPGLALAGRGPRTASTPKVTVRLSDTGHGTSTLTVRPS